MAEKRRGLGRGLGSLIPSQETGRPSDVFFPRSERSDPDSQADSQEAEREKLPSDPAESMRRAQAGRRTGTAKRPPAKGSTEKPAASKSAATKATTAAAKTTKSPARKSAAASTSGTAGRKTPASPVRSLDNDSKAAQTASNSGTVDERSKTETIAESISPSAGVVGPDPAVDQPSQEPSANEIGETDTSVDGVYVSRETVRAQASDEAPSVPSDTADVEDAAVEAANDQVSDGSSPVDAPESTVSADQDLPSGADGSGEAEGAAPQSGDQPGSSVSDVPRETDGDQDDDSTDLVPVPGTTFGEISLDRIRPNPRQPRDVFDEDALDELITSIREIGVLQPVVVRRRTDAPGQYELIMGERRFRASKDAGKETIPAIVRETSNDDLLRDALLENLHRVDLNPLEEAAAYAQLLEDFNCTQEELSERIGRSRPQISNTIRLLKLPGMVQRRVAAGVLSSGHARALLGLNDGANMEVLAQRVVAEGLSVRATEEAVILLNRGDRSAVSRGTREPDPELAELARSLGDRLDTRVNLVMGKRKGKLSVEFANGEDLSRILSLLGLDGGSSEE